MISVRSASEIYKELKFMPTSYIKSMYESYSVRYYKIKGYRQGVDVENKMMVRFRMLAWNQVLATVKILRERKEWNEVKRCPFPESGRIYTP